MLFAWKRGDKLTRRVKSYFQKPNSSNTFATSWKKVLEIRKEEWGGEGVHLCGCWTTLNPLFRPPDLWHTFAHTHTHTHTNTPPPHLPMTCLSHLFDCDNEIPAAKKKQFYFAQKTWNYVFQDRLSCCWNGNWSFFLFLAVFYLYQYRISKSRRRFSIYTF